MSEITQPLRLVLLSSLALAILGDKQSGGQYRVAQVFLHELGD
jgi:hypothetical protein